MTLRPEGIRRAAALLIVLGVAWAAEAEWFSNGPFCAEPFGFSAGPTPTSDAYLSAGGRIFRSRDGWRTWQEVEGTLPLGFNVSVPLAADPADPERVFTAVWRAGLYRSLDGGAQWERLDLVLPQHSGVIEVFKPDPSRDRVFALTQGPRSLYRSDDLGETWDLIDLPGGIATPPHPRSADRFWIAGFGGGLFRTDDGGDSWLRADAGLPQEDIDYVTVDPDDPSRAFAVESRDLFRTDDAHHWSLVGSGGQLPVTFPTAFLALPGAPPVLLLGDLGDSGGPDPGVYRSADGGSTWDGGLIGENVKELLYHAGTGRVIAFTNSGAFVSSDLGVSWGRIGAGVDVAGVGGLAAAGDPGRPVLVATLSPCGSNRLARSEDGGRTWEVGGYFDSSFLVGEVLTAPSDSDRLYAYLRTLRRSDDGGSTWQFCGDAFEREAIAVHPTDPDVVYGLKFGELALSLDGCQSWGPEFEPVRSVSALAFDPGDPDRLFVGSGFRDGVARSLDGGATWHRLDVLEDGSIAALAVDPHDPDVLLVGSSEPRGEVHRSSDGGDTWIPVTVDLHGDSLLDIAFDPLTPGVVVAAAGTAGIYRSADGGGSWEPWPGSTDLDFVRQVMIDPRGRVFAVADRGVYSPEPLTRAESCEAGEQVACLFDGAFEVTGATWDFEFPPAEHPLRVMRFEGGRAESDQAAFFESFRTGNFEVGIKMVDACELEPGHPNRAYWVFAGGLTNAQSEILVEDTLTGAQYRWENPAGAFPRSVGDTGAFPCIGGTPSVPCVRADATACLLGGRFRVTGLMHDFSDPPRAVPARVIRFAADRAESEQAVFFDSFRIGNFEVGVKMVDACALPTGNPLRAYWAFYGGLTNAETQVVITQRETGEVDEWSNQGGTFALSEGNTRAFPCPDGGSGPGG